jgi:hypothetical protein
VNSIVPNAASQSILQAKTRYLMDIYDGAEWTDMDIGYLKAAIEAGISIEEAAQFLCRADSVEDVRRKCQELGLA